MLKDWQKELITEAVRNHVQQEMFGQKLLSKFRHSVTAGIDTLVGQIEIIVGADKEQE